ncbi:MAG: hypothetical protein ACC707_19995, partial [Thiohalomonadales bacterium]
QGVFNDFTTGRTKETAKGVGNPAKRMSKERVLKLNDFESEYYMLENYSDSGGYYAAHISERTSMAGDTALMEKAGPDARDNVETVIKRIRATARKGGQEEYERFDKRIRALEKNVWPLIDGSGRDPDSHAVAKFLQGYRSINNWAMLGMATVSSFPDIAIYAATVKHDGGSFLGGALEAIQSVIGHDQKGNKALLSELGIFLDTARSASMQRYDIDRIEIGLFSKMNEVYFRLNLLSHWTERLATGHALSRSSELAGLSGTKLANLNEGKRRMLRQFGIEEAEWDMIRKGTLVSAGDKKFLSPESIYEVDDAIISQYLKGKGMPSNKTSIEMVRHDIDGKMKGVFSRADSASLKPNVATRAFMTQGLDPGSVRGAVLASTLQFKAYPITVIRQTLQREIYGHRSDFPTLGQAVRSPTAIANVARFAALGTMIGFLTIYTKDWFAGKKTPEITDENFGSFFARSLLASGAFSFWGDFFVGEAKSRYGTSPIASAFGPIGQDVERILKLRTKIWQIEPDFEGAALEATRIAMGKIPLNNLWSTKYAFDYLVRYNIMELTKPGALREMERTKKREMGVEFYMPPSSVIPRGGGLPNF